VRRLSARALKDYLDHVDAPPLLLDVREPWEYQVCHLPGSQLVPMRQIPTAVGGLDRGRETVVICHHGVRSFAVARFLEQAGFTNVVNLEGGVAAWAREVDPGMPTY
jgi:rhodanese-related sulfurtransferase